MMKSCLYILLLFSLVACSSPYEFDLPEAEQMIVCNCLFSPDELWELQLTHTDDFAAVGSNNAIVDARVFIISAENDTLQLVHSRKGIYRSLYEKPEAGTKYRMNAYIGNDTITSSESAVPPETNFELLDFNENPGLVQYGFFTMNEVYALDFNLEFEDTVRRRILVRAMLYDSVRSAKHYTFNQAVYDSMLQLFNDQTVIERIAFLEGDTIYGQNNLHNLLSLIFGSELEYKQIKAIMDAAYLGQTSGRNEEAFLPIGCLSPSAYFLNFEYEDLSLLGTFEQSDNFQAYVWNFLEGEYWFQCKVLSDEAFRYYKSYLEQLSGRTDNYTLTEPVFSNIKNGVGIFAGYSEKYIKIK